ATPVTGFETNHRAVEQAIAASQPGATALNLEQALEFARQTQQLSARRPGEGVFIGSGRVSESENASLAMISVHNLQLAPVTDEVENCGLRKIGLRRSASSPDVWEIFVSVRNYGRRPRTVNLSLLFGGAPAGAQTLSLPAGAEQEAVFERRT